MHSVHCKRIQQQIKIKFVAESATLLFFWSSSLFGFHKQNLKLSTAQNHCSKNRRTCGIRNRIAESRTFYGIHKQIMRHYGAKLGIPCIVSGFRNRPRSNLSRNPQLYYFFDLLRCLDSTNKNLKHSTAQNHRTKNRRNCGIRNRICWIQNVLWNPQTHNATFV